MNTQPGQAPYGGPDGFPYTRSNFDLNGLWAHAYASWRRDWLMLSVGAFIFFVITLTGSMVTNAISRVILLALDVESDPQNPFGSVKGFLALMLVGQASGVVVNMIVQGIGLLGMIRLIMDVLVGQEADVTRMFAKLRKLPTFIVNQLILFVIVTIPSLLFMAGVFVASLAAAGISVRDLDDVRWESLLNGTTLSVLVGGFLVYMAIALFVLLPLSIFPVMEILVSECGPFEAIVRAWRIGGGLRVRLVGYGFVTWLMILGALLLCCIPVIPVFPLAYSLLVAFFLAARNGLDLAPADHS